MAAIPVNKQLFTASLIDTRTKEVRKFQASTQERAELLAIRAARKAYAAARKANKNAQLGRRFGVYSMDSIFNASAIIERREVGPDPRLASIVARIYDASFRQPSAW